MAVFYFFAGVLVWLSFRSFLGGLRYLRFFREELRKAASGYAPYVSVIAPCRGLEQGLAENLSAILDQEYPHFEVIFVVDDKNDKACTVIQELISGGPAISRTARLLVASKATKSSQKVQNLIAGTQDASEDSQVMVFVDSDARPSPHWLRHLVTTLKDERVGVATGYRWFISGRGSFAAELLSVWNASIASALGPRSAFCWGGSTAIRREIFERLDITRKWQGAVSDDFVLAQAVKAAGLRIAFVPQALTASFQSITFRGLFEFTNRQMKLTRVYAMPLWLVTLLGNGIFTLVMTAALVILAVRPITEVPALVSIATLLVVSILSIGKSSLRAKAVGLVLPQYAHELQKQFWPHNTLWPLSSALFFVNCIAALMSRSITWRGIMYELKSPTETVIIAPK